MSLFIGIHTLPNTSEEKAIEAWGAYKVYCEVCGLKATHAYYNIEKRVGYCFTEAETVEEVWKAHEGMAVPLDDVFEIKKLT